jgi:hypothetical protein
LKFNQIGINVAVPDLGLEVGKFITGGRKDMVSGFALMGLMQGHFDVPNLNEDVVTDTDAPENSVHTGIDVVIPVEKIMETLNQPVSVPCPNWLIWKRSNVPSPNDRDILLLPSRCRVKKRVKSSRCLGFGSLG